MKKLIWIIVASLGFVLGSCREKTSGKDKVYLEENVTRKSDVQSYVPQEDSANLYNFDFRGGYARVIGYKGNGPDMNIPSRAGGKPVTVIAKKAFSYNQKIVRVSIPGSVKEIEGYAFQGCKNLSCVTISNGVRKIGKNGKYSFEDSCVFDACINLTQITIPGSVEIIGACAFSDCKNLSSVTIQEGVKEIGSCAFALCSNLINITIPDSVKIIDSDAFGGCHKLKSITISKDTYFAGYETYKPLPLQIDYR